MHAAWSKMQLTMLSEDLVLTFPNEVFENIKKSIELDQILNLRRIHYAGKSGYHVLRSETTSQIFATH